MIDLKDAHHLLGVSKNAWEILLHLPISGDDIENEVLETFAWYNGREKGIGISFYIDQKRTKQQVIIFGNDRVANHMIFVDCYVRTADINFPQISNTTEKQWATMAKSRKMFKTIEDAAEHIKNLIIKPAGGK